MKPTVLKDCIHFGATEMIVPPIEEQDAGDSARDGSAVTRDGWRWIVDAHREGRR